MQTGEHQQNWEQERWQEQDTAWDRWIDRAERLFGRSLDGDQVDDGYSMDGAFDAFRDGCTAAEYVGRVRDERERRGIQPIDNA